MINRKFSTLARLSALAAAMLWGSSFFVVKGTLETIDPNFMNALRHTLSFVVLALVFFKKMRTLTNRGYLLAGAVIGFFMFGGNLLVAVGMNLDTTPGTSSFLTSVYCAIVPFLYWILYRKRPDKYAFIAVALCVIGMGLVAITDNFSVKIGDLFTLLGSIFYAAHAISIGHFTKERDPILIASYQFLFNGLFSWITAFLAGETFPTAFFTGTELLFPLLYLALACGSLAGFLQMFGQKHTDVNSAAILLSLESVFGVLFSVIFYGETLTVRLITGFALIFIGVVISETKLSFLHKKKD